MGRAGGAASAGTAYIRQVRIPKHLTYPLKVVFLWPNLAPLASPDFEVSIFHLVRELAYDSGEMVLTEFCSVLVESLE